MFLLVVGGDVVVVWKKSSSRDGLKVRNLTCAFFAYPCHHLVLCQGFIYAVTKSAVGCTSDPMGDAW